MAQKRVLHIEDDPDSRDLVREVLADEGYSVAEASNGGEAMQKISEETFDVILLDVMLPGMSGLDILRSLRQSDNPTPVVMVTGRTGFSTTSESFALGAVAYVTKPVDPDHLLVTINELTAKRDPGGS